MNPMLSDDVLIRPAEPSDAGLIIQGLIRCYGDSYPNPKMYQVKEVENLIQSKLMHSLIAITPQGSVVGHCALSYEHPLDNIPEAGKLFVDPQFRGKHISDLLARERKKHAESIGLQGFWAACVTNHPYSQLEIIALGGVETGLLINGQPKSVHMDGLHNNSDTRHSLIPCYVSIQEVGSKTLFLSKNHEPFFDNLLEHSGFSREVSYETQPNNVTDQSSLSLNHSSEAKPSFIKVSSIGKDFLRRIETLVKSVRQEKHPVIYVDMPLSHPMASRAINELESLGFFWGAWLPNYDQSGDVLRMQCILDSIVSEASIICARNNGELVRDYVLSEWRRTY